MNELSLVFSFIPAISFVRDNLKCEETDNNEHSSHKEEWTNESSKFIKGDSKNGPNNKANTDTAFYVANNRSLSISIQNRSKRVASGLDGRWREALQESRDEGNGQENISVNTSGI